MIKKLQIKFILLAMTALLAVLTVIIVGINIANYFNIVEDADEVLEILADNKGRFPSGKDKGLDLPPKMSVETPYESRYFSVSVNTNSYDVIHVETSRIIAVDTAEVMDYVELVLNSHKESGFIDAFRYVKHTNGTTMHIIFLDCGRKLDSFRNFFLTSVIIAFVGYIVVFAVVAFFSNKIIRPISESYEKQKRFITDAGHEIKTPLTIINADVDVLELELGENEWLQDIQKQSSRLTDLTNDLVYLARMEEASDSMQMIEFPFSDVVSEATASFQALAQIQGKVFQCNIPPMLSLKGNEKAIHQLINILLDNALKYSPVGGTVSLTVEKQSKVLLLSVFNTTENPIPKENLHLLFERFYRIDPSRNSQTGGHGIGLSIAKAIAMAHNSKIQALTDDGFSLQITVSFPI